MLCGRFQHCSIAGICTLGLDGASLFFDLPGSDPAIRLVSALVPGYSLYIAQLWGDANASTGEDLTDRDKLTAHMKSTVSYVEGQYLF